MRTPVLVAVATLLLFAACADPDPPGVETLVEDAAFPVTVVPLPDGGLYYAERLTGVVRHVDADGELQTEPVAHLEVSTEGQRGLLGLARSADGSLYAAWTDPDTRLVVGRIDPAPVRIAWRGPLTEEQANGGRIAFDPDGGLVVGIGDLLDPERIPDPTEPHGKLLRLDPQGPPTQDFEVISAGWNNPFAFAYSAAGELWVADNAPGELPDRLARGDIDGEPARVTELPETIAPAGLTVDGDGHLLVCGFVSRTLQRHVVENGRAAAEGEMLARDCSLDVALLAEAIVYSNEEAVRTIER